MNTKKITRLIISSLLLVLLTGYTSSVFASTLSVQTDTKNLGVEDEYKVTINLSSPDEPVNALEGSVSYPADILELMSAQNGGSVVPFWIESPIRKNYQFPGKVTFSGMIPGGFDGNNGLLFSLVFKVKAKGQIKIGIDNARLLKHDGSGTEASLSISEYTTEITSDSQKPLKISEVDTVAPEEFTALVSTIREQGVASRYVLFSTTDKGTGIDRYEVLESSDETTSSQPWIEANSPHKLTNQHSDGYVFVKAIDKSGNERIAKVKMQGDSKSMQTVLLLITIAALFLTAVVFKTATWLQRKRKL